MNSRLSRMIDKGTIPNLGGIWIDCYNGIIDKDCAGSILTGIDYRNIHFITEAMKNPIICASRGRGKENVQQLEAREDGVTNTITSVQKDNLIVLGWSRDSKGKVTNRHPVKVANAVTSGKRENTQNYVVIPQATKKGNIQMEIGGVADLSYPTSKTRCGRVQDNGRISPALTCHTENALRRIEPEYRIRKLTPRECFRLMGVGEKDIDKLLGSGISNSQLYKLAGNSIVVNCLAGIFRQLFVKNENKVVQLEIF